MSELLARIDLQAVALIGIGLTLAYCLRRIMTAKNPLEWWHFIATKGADSHYYADLDKLWLNVGGFVGSLVILFEAYNARLEWAIFTAYLAFVSGVKAYSSYLRSKQGSVVTEKVVEPLPDPAKVTTTTTKIPPIKGKK